MVTIKPFHAWHYEPSKVSIERVIAPPYDVISKEGEKKLRARDPHNVIRLILGQATPEEIEQDARYGQARQHLEEWVKEGVLSKETKTGFYLYETSFKHPFQNKILTRLAVFALLKLEPFERKVVFPHEKTHSSPKLDRKKLIEATHANFSPIFAVYEDVSVDLEQIHKSCLMRTPLFDFRDEEQFRHRLWRVDAKDEIGTLEKSFDRKRIFIADGHHRYETALRHSEELGAENGARPSDYVLATFVRFTDPGLLILPIHRLILSTPDGRTFEKASFIQKLKEDFVLHAVSRSAIQKVAEGAIGDGFGLTFSENENYILEPKDKTRIRQKMPADKVKSWYDLDVTQISYLIVEPLLGIENKLLEKHVRYTPSLDEVFRALQMKQALMSFIVRPVSAQTIKDICESGELMPQKSTYFYPKFPSGLLMHRHE